eukprot:CAMPEP_0174868378 /NCGR_PEP_ID=MMETSP1114-20130205/65877_1 /TAXON_ID=312471 /ORGANISM="Neobodo designis, Strain CCAP 1951/1" /LENGTH=78 /DNA_ID=CAMNT_0016103595 /DNA_START=369 /DNA_END=601 /DNA_ORIENTATION=-
MRVQKHVWGQPLIPRTVCWEVVREGHRQRRVTLAHAPHALTPAHGFAVVNILTPRCARRSGSLCSARTRHPPDATVAL